MARFKAGEVGYDITTNWPRRSNRRRLPTGICRLISLASLLALVGSCSVYDAQQDTFSGEKARDRIARRTAKGRSLPDSARNFYIFDGGTFSGSITYLSFDCGTIEDCWAAVRSLDGPEKSEFVAWHPSKYAVVMNGPGFYWREIATDHWDVRTIRNGFVHEYVRGGNEWMEFWAIDSDTRRVYYHHESGGFPTKRYEGDGK
jgi:hypothetical protein